MLIIFPLIFFLFFTQLILTVFTLSHARFCIYRFCWWDMRVLEDEGSKVKTTEETKFTTICSLNCRPLIQLVYLKSEPAWKETVSQTLPLLLEGFGKYQLPAGSQKPWTQQRCLSKRRPGRWTFISQPHLRSCPSGWKITGSPLSPKLLPPQEHNYRWAGGY